MSAFVIDFETYKTFADVLQACFRVEKTRSAVTFPILEFARKHYSGFYKMEDDPFDPSLVRWFVGELVKLNYVSFGYRYREDEAPPEVEELLKTLCPEGDSAFPFKAKPRDFLEVASFLACWDYQSCEKPEHCLTVLQKDLLKAVEALRAAFLEAGLLQAVGEKPSWGDLKFTFGESKKAR